MSLDVFLEILRAFEGFAAEFTFVWLQRNMDSNVRGDVVTLDSCGAATTPLTRQVQVVGALAADVSLAHMFLRGRSVKRSSLGAMAFTREGSLDSHRALQLKCISHRSLATGTVDFHHHYWRQRVWRLVEGSVVAAAAAAAAAPQLVESLEESTLSKPRCNRMILATRGQELSSVE